MTIRTLIRFGISAVVFLVFLLHTSNVVPMRFLATVENFTYDARVVLTLPDTNDPRIVVLDLDERSLAAEGQWPWRRDKMAQLVRQLFDKYQIAVLGFDIVFAERDDRALKVWNEIAASDLADVPGISERVATVGGKLDYDAQFAEAIRGRPVVMGFFFKPALNQGEAAATGMICEPLIDANALKLYAVDFIKAVGAGGNVDKLQAATPACGFFDNPSVDADGVYRRVPLLQHYQGAVYPSLALAVTRMALGNAPVDMRFDPPDVRTSLHLESVRIGPVRASGGEQYFDVPVDEEVAAYVPYRGDNRTFTYVSTTDVLNGKVADPEVLRNKIVLMGTTAAGLLDFRTTPVNKVFAGVEVHANIVSGILDGRIRQKAPYYSGIEFVLLLIVALVIAWAFTRLSAVASALVVLGLVGALLVLGFAMWSGANFIMPLGVPVLFTLTVFMAHLLYGYFIESRAKRDISKRFGQYVPPEIVEEMAEHPEAVSMEGEAREMTVLFSDVRGFTSISEKLDAKELSALMNAFLTKQTAVIQKHRGTIDKYMGDAIMAFWGAPLPDKEHALHAVSAGLDMLKAVRELDGDFQARGWAPLHIGVGLNSGKMNVGNMGSEFRMAYTVMGDAVNLGSRLEGLTKQYGVEIMCSEFTRNQLPTDWSFRELDLVRVKGKAEPVAIYEPMGPKEALDPGLRNDLARLRGALKVYRAQQWDAAENEFFSLSRSGRPHKLYELYLHRIADFRKNPPPPNWDGAWNWETK